MRIASWFARPPGPSWRGYAWAVAATAASTGVGLAVSPVLEPVNIAMLYLLAVVFVSLRFSRGPAIASSVLGVAALDFCFVPPRFTFEVADAQYLFTFAIMLAVALVISALVEAARRAETENVRNALLASISHDLRTPLSVISGTASRLEQDDGTLDAAERANLARAIGEQSRAMAELVANVLQMTRLHHGAIVIERDWVGVEELFGSVLRRLETRLATHPVSVDLSEDMPLVRLDATLVEQALGNLLENAARHTPEGTPIVLRAQARDTEAMFSVEDAGPGMPPANANSGLGLAICRAIVELHGGNLWAERLSPGTAMRFTLALEAPPAAPPEGAER